MDPLNIIISYVMFTRDFFFSVVIENHVIFTCFLLICHEVFKHFYFFFQLILSLSSRSRSKVFSYLFILLLIHDLKKRYLTIFVSRYYKKIHFPAITYTKVKWGRFLNTLQKLINTDVLKVLVRVSLFILSSVSLILIVTMTNSMLVSES